MNFDEIVAQWRTQPAVAPDRNAVVALARQIERRHRRTAALQGLYLCFVVANLGFTAYVIHSRGVAVVEQAWPALLVQGIALALLVVMMRRRAALLRASQAMDANAVEAVRHGIAEADARVREMRWVAAAMALFCVLLAIAARTLVLSGKMRVSDAVSLGVLCALAVVPNLACFVWTYVKRIRPARSRLTALLHQYTN